VPGAPPQPGAGRVPDRLQGKGGLVLYVSDSGALHIRSYPVDPTNGAVNEKQGKVFFDAATENKNPPDGMTMDERGNLYFTGRGGVWAVSPNLPPDKRVLGFIAVPEFCSNCTFGGPDGSTLFLTCQSRVAVVSSSERLDGRLGRRSWK